MAHIPAIPILLEKSCGRYLWEQICSCEAHSAALFNGECRIQRPLEKSNVMDNGKGSRSGTCSGIETWSGESFKARPTYSQAISGFYRVTGGLDGPHGPL